MTMERQSAYGMMAGGSLSAPDPNFARMKDTSPVEDNLQRALADTLRILRDCQTRLDDISGDPSAVSPGEPMVYSVTESSLMLRNVAIDLDTRLALLYKLVGTIG